MEMTARELREARAREMHEEDTEYVVVSRAEANEHVRGGRHHETRLYVDGGRVVSGHE